MSSLLPLPSLDAPVTPPIAPVESIAELLSIDIASMPQVAAMPPPPLEERSIKKKRKNKGRIAVEDDILLLAKRRELHVPSSIINKRIANMAQEMKMEEIINEDDDIENEESVPQYVLDMIRKAAADQLVELPVEEQHLLHWAFNQSSLKTLGWLMQEYIDMQLKSMMEDQIKGVDSSVNWGESHSKGAEKTSSKNDSRVSTKKIISTKSKGGTKSKNSSSKKQKK